MYIYMSVVPLEARWALDPLDLELHMVVCCHVVVRNLTWVLCITLLHCRRKVGVVCEDQRTN